MIRRVVMNTKGRDRILHEDQGRCFWRSSNLICIILLMLYVQYCIWFNVIMTEIDWNLFLLREQKLLSKSENHDKVLIKGNQEIFFAEFCVFDNLTLERYISISRSCRNKKLVFLEFLGHGEFKFLKSCQKLHPSLSYWRLVFIPFFWDTL